jgi:hypothetical protein
MDVTEPRLVHRVANLGKSHPAKLIGPVNATVFILFQRCLLFYYSKQYPVLVYPVIFPASFFSPAIFSFPILLYLTANWPATLYFFSTLFTTPTAHPVLNLCAINRPFSVCMLTIAGTSSKQTFRRHTRTHPVHQEHHAHSALFRARG